MSASTSSATAWTVLTVDFKDNLLETLISHYAHFAFLWFNLCWISELVWFELSIVALYNTDFVIF